MNKSCVYWIHLPEHTDMFSQGYVGVAKGGVVKRYREHRHAVKNGSNLRVHNTMRKHEDSIIVDTIVLAAPEYCYEIEAALRPIPNIGYNISAGGISTNLGSVRSKESKQRMSEAQKARNFSEESRERMKTLFKDKKHSDETKAKMSVAAKVRVVSHKNILLAIEHNKNLQPWENPNSNKSLWLEAGNIYKLVQEFPEYGTRSLSNFCDFSYSQLSCLYKKIKTGWNPFLDTEWLMFSSKLTPDTSGNKSINSGDSPQQIN